MATVIFSGHTLCCKKLWARCTASMEVVCVDKCLGVQLHLVGTCQHVYGDHCSRPRTPCTAVLLNWVPTLTHKESTCAKLGCRVDLVSKYCSCHARSQHALDIHPQHPTDLCMAILLTLSADAHQVVLLTERHHMAEEPGRVLLSTRQSSVVCEDLCLRAGTGAGPSGIQKQGTHSG